MQTSHDCVQSINWILPSPLHIIINIQHLQYTPKYHFWSFSIPPKAPFRAIGEESEKKPKRGEIHPQGSFLANFGAEKHFFLKKPWWADFENLWDNLGNNKYQGQKLVLSDALAVQSQRYQGPKVSSLKVVLGYQKMSWDLKKLFVIS